MSSGRGCCCCCELLPLLALALLLAAVQTAAGRAPLRASAACQPRPHFPFNVMQLDEEGRACWGPIRVMTCSGHCRSHEVPDWRFPYKRSHHPVCIHDEVRLRSVTLEHCDPGAAAGTDHYNYLDAVSCKCGLCHSALASCEGAKFRSTRSWMPVR